MIIRKIGKILRGQATPLQIMLACILGAMIGFVPGFMNGPGLMVALFLLLVMLNANLGLAILIGGAAKAISFPLLPVSFAAGRMLLDGPTQGIFKTMINAPVLALFGLDHYATTGGMVIGLIFGIVSGLLIIKLVKRFRTAMAGLEESSETFKMLASTRWARTLTWIFFGGGHGKATYSDLLTKKLGNPIRIPGVIFAVLVVGLLFVLSKFASGPIVTMALQRGLEQTNGATVEIGSAEIDLAAGKLVVTDLAMCDPNALGQDLFRAKRIEADISGADLLRKQIKLDKVVITEASTGELRATPGKRTSTAPRATTTDNDRFVLKPGEKTIEEYIARAEVWKERLSQVRRWLEKISGGDDSATPDQETLDARIAREIRELGYARVRATHLIDGAPTLEITQLIAQGVTVAQLEGETLDIHGENLSTHPHLASGRPGFKITSRSGNIFAESKPVPGSASSTIVFSYLGLAVDSIAGDFNLAGTKPMQGGTMDISLNGTWSEAGVGYLDLPLLVTLYNTTLSLPGIGSETVSKFSLPIALRGPMDDPRITVDGDRLGEALVQAGASKLADDLLGEATEKLGENVGGEIKDALKGLFGGKKDKDDG